MIFLHVVDGQVLSRELHALQYPYGVINTGESILQMIEVFHPVREDFLDKIK